MSSVAAVQVSWTANGEVAVAAKDAGALEDVVVTAQRRSENLQEVPISISAFSGETLEKINAKGAGDYLAATPNVSFTEDKQSGSRGLTVSIRGVNNLVTGENAFVNSVGVYMDEFSIASVPNGVSNPFMPDMERIEVLRDGASAQYGSDAIADFQAEELEHRDHALAAGAEQAVGYPILSGLIRLGGKVAIATAKRI